MVARFAFTGYQFKGAAGQQAADIGVIQRELWTAQFNTRAVAQQIHHAGVNGHFAGHCAAGVQIEFG